MKKAIINSLPKSGTNLLAKCLNLFGYTECGHISAGSILDNTFSARLKKIFWESEGDYYTIGVNTPTKIRKSTIDAKLKNIKENQFISSHVGYDSTILESALDHEVQPIQVIRDPRAVLASFVPYIRADKHHFLHSSFVKLDQQEQYKVVLEGYSDGKHELKPLLECCKALESWLNNKEVLTIKFEDIVGSAGGGSDTKQKENLEILMSKLDIPPTLLQPTIENLYGPGRHTFRKGQIESWREEIPEDLLNKINSDLEEVLAVWGYKQ